MVTGVKAVLKIDLNRLDGDRISASTRFAVGGYLPTLEIGDLVETVEAEGDRYLGRVEGFGGTSGTLVYLVLDLDSWVPAYEQPFSQEERVMGGLPEGFISYDPKVAVGGSDQPLIASSH